ncbi:MAG: protein kinase [Acidobacteria bacterium]|nr:protein kinase [Acidobacteriota bacterium]
MKKLFGDAGYEVITAQDGKAALDLFAQEQPDVVLLSAMLSKVNGFDVCRQIKESDSGKGTAVIIATSVYKGQKYRVKAIHENKASEFVEKPIPDEQLLEIVRRYAGETQALISSKRDSIREKQREIAEEVAEESTIDSMLDASLKPSTARPVSPSAAPPEPVKAPPPVARVRPGPTAAEPEPRVLDVEKLLKDEIASTVLAQEVKSAPVDSDESLDRLLSDTLSGLGISLDTKDRAKAPKPAPAPAPVAAAAAAPAAPAAPAATAVAPVMPDTGQLKIKQLEEDILRDKDAEDSAKAVERLMMSFDTDLERKLSDTLSGVGLSDTSIGKVIESPRPEPEEEVVEEGQKFGEYALIEKIGHGGMAELFKAKKRGHEGFQKIVAIKRILPHLSDNKELVTMFIDEAKIAAQLTHQNIANIFDFGKIDNSYYIAMEHVDGFDLKKVLSKAKEIKIRVPHKIAAYIALQIASALDYAHHKKDFNNKEMNIVHRDVSPQNILISREGEVKLVDFGISKAESKIHHTVKGALKGKLLYMSPEQAWGKNVNKSSDIYSLGIVLCEMVSGKVLFEDSSEFDVLEKVRSGKIPLLDNELNNLPPRLKQIVDKALMIDSAKRYQNAASMIKDLHDYLHAGGAVPTPKDLAQILIRVFPDYFGLKEAEVQHLSFDEFQEGAESAAPKPPSEETVLLGQDEMAGLQAMPVETRARAAAPPAVNEEIIVSSQAKPADKPSSAPTAPFLTPVAAAPAKPMEPPTPTPQLKPAADQRKPLEIRKPAEAKKAPEPVKPPPKKAPEPKKPVEVRKAPEPVKAPEPKPAPAAPAAPKAPVVPKAPVAPKPADDKSPTKLLKEQKRASQAPAFTAAAPAGKPFPKGILIGAAAGVVIIILLIVLFMGGGKKEPEPAPGTRQEQAGPSEPSSEPGTSSGEPAPGETGETPSSTAPGPSQTAPVAGTRPDAKTPPPGTPQPPQPVRPNVQPAAIGVIPGAQGTSSVPLPTSGLPFLPPQPAPAAPAPVPTAPAPPPATAPRPAATPAVQPRSDFQLGLPTAQDQVKTGDLVALTSDVKPPKPVAQPSPSNPSDAAKRINIRGKVTVTCGLLVSHTGAVEKVIIRSVSPPNAGPIYSGPVQSALAKWRYTPAEKSGVKVKVWTNVTLAFEVR